MSRRDVQICKDILDKGKYDSQRKLTMKYSYHKDVSNQLVELPPTIKMDYSNLLLAEDVLHANDVHLLTSTHNHIHNGIFNAVDNMKGITLEQ